jgi:DNA-binding CsgD family transcriptional regulator
MSALGHLLARLGFRGGDFHSYELDEQLYTALEILAEEERRPSDEVHADLLAGALEERNTREVLLAWWRRLSPREQDVAALTCLGYTNRQIAARLQLSPATVKGYVRQVLVKFRAHGKEELRVLLRHWDFSAWGPEA